MNEEYIDNVKHLIEQKDADQVKELLADLHPADIAELCNDLNPSSTSGKNSITAIPTSIIETAHMHPTFMVRIMRSFFCAP